MYTLTTLLDDFDIMFEPDNSHPSLKIRTKARVFRCFFLFLFFMLSFWTISAAWHLYTEPFGDQPLLNRLTSTVVIGTMYGYGVIAYCQWVTNMIVDLYGLYPHRLPNFLVAKEDKDGRAYETDDVEKGTLVDSGEEQFSAEF
ncbi:MAG: hypothetical protein LQ346_006558 [Caloplaca aetnensis]|nr:MAG: hypothetical protein LQ346_006558 [Caloplaca aetnensis]